jgi:hypothetical protein
MQAMQRARRLIRSAPAGPSHLIEYSRAHSSQRPLSALRRKAQPYVAAAPPMVAQLHASTALLLLEPHVFPHEEFQPASSGLSLIALYGSKEAHPSNLRCD